MFENEKLRQHEGKFYGEYRGKVLDNKDPKMLGRVKVEVPAVYGDGIESPWCYGKFPAAGKNYGMFLIPSIGDFVWVTFEMGSPDYPIWSGAPYTVEIHPRIKKTRSGKDRKNPDVMMLKIQSGRMLVFDDDPEKPCIHLLSPSGNSIIMDDDPKNQVIEIKHKSGSKVVLEMDGSITISPSNGKGTVIKSSLSVSGKVSCGDLTATGTVNLG